MKLDPNNKTHVKIKKTLKIIGPIFIIIGIFFIARAIISFMYSFNHFSELSFNNMSSSSEFINFLIGAIFLGIGGQFTKIGYLREFVKYTSEEVSPIAKETINYVMKDIKEEKNDLIYCKHCGKKISSDSTYCQYCGKKL